MNKWLLSLLGLCVLAAAAVSGAGGSVAHAAEQGVTVYIDSRSVPVREQGVLLSGGKALVDAEVLFVADGYKWTSADGTLRAQRGSERIVLTAGSKQAMVNGASRTLTTAVAQKNDKLLVQLEDFAWLTDKQLSKSMNGRSYYLTSHLKDRIGYYLYAPEHKVVYEGGMSAGKKSGSGKLTVNGILLYEGAFANDAMSGKGKLYLNGSLAVEGGFLDNAPHGVASYALSAGERYVGDFVHGRRTGSGTLYRGETLVYTGEWLNDGMTGAGTLYDGSGMVYTGDLRNNIRHGFGISYRDGKKEYQGDWVMGKREGSGMQFGADGRLVYMGYFKADAYNGAGTKVQYSDMTWYGDGPSNTIVSEVRETSVLTSGTFVDGVQVSRSDTLFYTGASDSGKVPNGIGQIFKYTGNTSTRSGVLQNSELIYAGDVKDGKRHGAGTEYAGGKPVYEGGFVDNVRSGIGREYENGLLMYDGEWKAGFRNGKGKSYQYAGSVATYSGPGTVIITEGSFMAGKLRTTDAMYKYAGDLKEGRLTGSGIVYAISASSSVSPFAQTGAMVYAGEFLDGRREGQGRSYIGGSLAYIGEFSNDKKNGTGELRSGGVRTFAGNFVDDKREGPGIAYGSGGSRIYEGNYKNDMRHGFGMLYEYGSLVYEGDFYEDKKHGAGKLYKNGTLIYEGEFIRDERADGK